MAIEEEPAWDAVHLPSPVEVAQECERHSWTSSPEPWRKLIQFDGHQVPKLEDFIEKPSWFPEQWAPVRCGRGLNSMGTSVTSIVATDAPVLCWLVVSNSQLTGVEMCWIGPRDHFLER
jgi:hypothetical protein